MLIRPTPRHRTSSPYRRYTWSFNPSGVRLPVLPPEPVSSYLTFSPFPFAFAQGGYFLLHYYTLTDIFPLGSMVLCVARTFLPGHRLLSGRGDGTACCSAKVINYNYFCAIHDKRHTTNDKRQTTKPPYSPPWRG
jgi:hypothetical protein